MGVLSFILCLLGIVALATCAFLAGGVAGMLAMYKDLAGVNEDGKAAKEFIEYMSKKNSK